MPVVAHFCGHLFGPSGGGRLEGGELDSLAERIDDHVRQAGVAAAYGSLAAGADLLVAERVLAHGGELHVVLPFAEAEFEAVSVRPAGDEWLARFAACIDSATSVVRATDGGFDRDATLFDLAARLAMGSALVDARQRSARVEQIAVWDGSPGAMPGGTADAVGRWRRAGRRTHVIDVPPRTRRPGSGDCPGRRREIRAVVRATSPSGDLAVACAGLLPFAPQVLAVRARPGRVDVVLGGVAAAAAYAVAVCAASAPEVHVCVDVAPVLGVDELLAMPGAGDPTGSSRVRATPAFAALAALEAPGVLPD